MRKIKFKVEIDGEWIPLTLDEMLEYAEQGNDIIKNCKKRQYIGLKDKNGVEIYDGDIVKCKTRDRNDKRKIDENFISEVYWDTDSYLVHDSPYCESPIGCYDGNNKAIMIPIMPTIEIIGNIYENKELLKWATNHTKHAR